MVLYIPGGWQDFFPSTVYLQASGFTVCFVDLFSAEEIQKQMAGISWFSREKDGDVTWQFWVLMVIKKRGNFMWYLPLYDLDT